jgi:hypothetical protein
MQAAMNSAIYHGTVRHRRMLPAEHSFNYHMFMMYLDLDELPRVFRGSRLFSSTRRAAARFCREDHLGSANIPLDQAVRDLVEQSSGRRPSGPIRLLTHLRYFGYVFNPVSFYYCFNADDTRLETIVAEVNNTPWGERECYVLDQAAEVVDAKVVDAAVGDAKVVDDRVVDDGNIRRYRPVKRMHVSPFMPMDVAYDWRFRQPAESLTVHMENSREGRKLFDATLVLQRQEITPTSLMRVLLAFPLMTLKIIIAIHWQALRLWLKKVPVIDHPARATRDVIELDREDGRSALALEKSK